MKKLISLLLISVIIFTALPACGVNPQKAVTSQKTDISLDYEDVSVFEEELNSGADLTGKTVKFIVNNLIPDSAFGYNMQTGEHLNFCSSENPNASVGDTVIVKVKGVESILGSYIIAYNMLSVSKTENNVSNTYSQIEEQAVQTDFKIGETWIVDGQWELTVTGFEETQDRNEYSEKTPAAVYIVSYTWKNIGYVDEDGFMDGLYIVLDDTIIDSQGLMGYSYPGDITDYPTETPVGASCNGQVCIGVDNAGTPIKLVVTHYDGNGTKQTANFILE